MPVTLVTLTGDVGNLIGADFFPQTPAHRRTKVWAKANIDRIIDTDTGKIHIGIARAKVQPDGTFAFVGLVGTGSADTNLDDSGDLQYTVYVKAPSDSDPSRDVVETFGPYSVPASADLRTLEPEQAVDVTATSELLAEMQALRDEVVDISGISTSDGVITAIDANPASAFRVQSDARHAASTAAITATITPPLGAVVAVGDNRAAIQAKADICEAAGTTLGIPAGTWTITGSGVVFHCSVLADPEAVFTGNVSPLVTVGNGTDLLERALLRLPKIVRQTKNWGVSPGPGAGTINTDVGLRIDDSRSIEVHFPYVQNFSIGVDIADDAGSLYNRYIVGHLDNNAINLRVATTGAGGAANESQFHGGRYSHNSGEGSNVTGTRHIALLTGSTVGPNNMLFLGGSIEGNTPQYHVVCEGSYNQFLGMRWEATTPKARFVTTGANHNAILGGYGAESVVVSTASSGKAPFIYAHGTFMRGAMAGDVDGAFVIQPSGSSAHPVLIGLDTTGDPFGTGAAAPSVTYGFRLSPQAFGGKRPADVADRMLLDFVNGRVKLGNGTSVPTPYIYGYSAGFIINGGGLSFENDNTYDVGGAGLRPRDVLVGRKVVIGTAQHLNGTGTPEGAVTAPVGSLYTRTDGGANTTLYVKESGAGNTGWVAK